METEKAVKRHSDKWFRLKAVALAREIGVDNTSGKLGISRSTLFLWMRNDGKRGGMKAKTPEAKAALAAAHEIRKLKREIEELEKANLILKEAATFFSKGRPDLSLSRPTKSQKSTKK